MHRYPTRFPCDRGVPPGIGGGEVEGGGVEGVGRDGFSFQPRIDGGWRSLWEKMPRESETTKEYNDCNDNDDDDDET